MHAICIYTHGQVCYVNDCQICIYIYTHGQVLGMGNGTSNMLAKVIDKYNLIFDVGFLTLELTFSLKFTYWSTLLTSPHSRKKMIRVEF